MTVTAERPSAGPAVRTRGLTKRFGDLFAVDHLDLDVPRGSVFGLIGPNGAGKTTTFSILASLLAPTDGEVEVGGLDPSADPRGVRRIVGYMPDVMGVYDGLRVGEYLEFFAAAYRLPRTRWPALVDGLLELVDLSDKRDTMVDSLSRGMKQRLSLARALVHDPEILILDEPASGLDPRARIDLRGLLGEMAAIGKTVIISSHILAELEEMCSHVAILDGGKVLAQGAPGDISATLAGHRTVLVRLAGGEVRRHEVADEAEQAALIRRLVVDEGLPVIEVTGADGGLEDLFLRVTRSGAAAERSASGPDEQAGETASGPTAEPADEPGAAE
ncbi:MAG TPA: ABC transporter ATP-binding protein [Acidimicrobiia bacterium]|jgi:ABC-2 type transport system ATP-binding protein|nr:ABC transporter ATP-binding protein [Acidimicrobiia bacterium]